MTNKKIILKSWWHEDLESEDNKKKLAKFTDILKGRVESEFEKPEGPHEIFEGEDYFFFHNKDDNLFEMNVTAESIDITYRGGKYNLSELISSFKKWMKETLVIHNSLGLSLDHYHFFIETIFRVHIKDIKSSFREKLGISVANDFLGPGSCPISSNIHYELQEAQSVIMSLILKDFDSKDSYDYKIKVDAGKIYPNYDTIKASIDRTEKNFIEIEKSKITK